MALYKWANKVAWSAGAGFNPWSWTAWQILTKTESGYDWEDAPATGVQSSNDTYEDIVYLSQSDYDALQNKDPNTLYSTPDGEAGTFVDDTTYASSWDWVTDVAPSKNAIYDKVNTMDTTISWKQAQHSAITVTLTSAWWSNNTQTVSATWVTASNTVIISPAPASFEDYWTAQIYCSSQSSNSLTFTCWDVPSSDLTVNVVILN